jgi:hypothetical protein
MTPGIRQVARLAANKTATTNVVLATLGLPVPCGANQRQHLKYWVVFTEAGVAAGAKFLMVTPAAMANFLLTFRIENYTTKALDNEGEQTVAANMVATGASIGAYLLTIEADLVTGVNAGTYDLQFAQQVSDVGVLTILLGAWVETTLN